GQRRVASARNTSWQPVLCDCKLECKETTMTEKASPLFGMTVYTCPTQGRLQPCILHVIKDGPAAAGGKSSVGEGRSASCGGREA
ncbi:unnamed protein product, partial [Pylaiella littoralis]